VRYPKERILLEYGGARRYFKNHLAWMIALAMSEGVTHLMLAGINYGHMTEYIMQRGSAEYWLGRAEDRGVVLMLPDECSLLAEPAGLYGYESHDAEGRLLEAYKEKVMKPAETIRPLKPGEVPIKPTPPAHLVKDLAVEEETRPDWARVFDQDNAPSDGRQAIPEPVDEPVDDHVDPVIISLEDVQ
jgi:hypothetical protein